MGADDDGGVTVEVPREWDAALYDRIADPQTRWGEALLEHLSGRGVGLVLDAGCGSGRVTEALLERFPDARVIALDQSAQMLAEAEARLERFGSRVRFVNADLEQSLPVERVDVVFSTATFHWVKDHRRLYGHLAEVLRPRGQLIAQFGGAGNIRSVIEALVSLGEPEPDTWCYPTPEEETALLERSGFNHVQAWLHEEPTPLDRGGPLEDYIEKIILRAQVEAKPEAERRPFAEAVAAALPRPVIDYVRINVVARRAG